MKPKLKRFWYDLWEFLQAAFTPKGIMTAKDVLRKEAFDENDNFLLLCFGDLLGLPLPVSYYTLELLPYLAQDLEGWERRMVQRKRVLAERWGKHEWCC